MLLEPAHSAAGPPTATVDVWLILLLEHDVESALPGADIIMLLLGGLLGFPLGVLVSISSLFEGVLRSLFEARVPLLLLVRSESLCNIVSLVVTYFIIEFDMLTTFLSSEQL